MEKQRLNPQANVQGPLSFSDDMSSGKYGGGMMVNRLSQGPMNFNNPLSGGSRGGAADAISQSFNYSDYS